MEIIILIIGGLFIGYFIWEWYASFDLKKQIKEWNKGIAPNGSYWEIYYTDREGRRYYVDSNERKYLCRITFTEVDIDMTYKNLP